MAGLADLAGQAGPTPMGLRSQGHPSTGASVAYRPARSWHPHATRSTCQQGPHIAQCACSLRG
eukprot:9121313-Alexandrium_andersonii.AAC.1